MSVHSPGKSVAKPLVQTAWKYKKKLVPSGSHSSSCHEDRDCSSCWRTCGSRRVLPPVGCGNQLCDSGCRVACFFEPGPPTSTSSQPLAYLAPPRLVGGAKLSWHRPLWLDRAAAVPFVVYVVEVERQGVWREYMQALDTWVPAPYPTPSRVRILAVSPSGVVSSIEARLVGSPDEDPVVELSHDGTTQEEQDEIQRYESPSEDISRDGLVFHLYDAVDSDGALATVVDPTWIPHVTGVKPGPLTEVELHWDRRGSSNVEYMITWREDSGGLSGHLLTKELSAILSLWPARNHLVQLELIDSHGNPVLKSRTARVDFIESTEHQLEVNTSYLKRKQSRPSRGSLSISSTAATPGSTQSDTPTSQRPKEQTSSYTFSTSSQLPLNRWKILQRDIPSPIYSEEVELSQSQSNINDVLWGVGISLGIFFLLFLVGVIIYMVSSTMKRNKDSESASTSVTSVQCSSLKSYWGTHSINKPPPLSHIPVSTIDNASIVENYLRNSANCKGIYC